MARQNRLQYVDNLVEVRLDIRPLEVLSRISATRVRNFAFISGTASSALSGSCRKPWIFAVTGLI